MEMAACDTEYNYSHAEFLMRKAAEDSDVIVLPETWNTGFFPEENIKYQVNTEWFEKRVQSLKKT